MKNILEDSVPKLGLGFDMTRELCVVKFGPMRFKHFQPTVKIIFEKYEFKAYKIFLGLL